MRIPGRKKWLEMMYKFCAYAVIIFGGTLSGALLGTHSRPISIHLSVENLGTLGACMGAFMAVLGCKCAMEREQATVRNREVFRILEGRLSRVVRSGSEIHDD
jgi:hypothetical protein